jgi:hypothetical protein
MREQTRRNIMYLAGLAALARLSSLLEWGGEQFDAAKAELIRRFNPSLAET